MQFDHKLRALGPSKECVGKHLELRAFDIA